MDISEFNNKLLWNFILMTFFQFILWSVLNIILYSIRAKLNVHGIKYLNSVMNKLHRFALVIIRIDLYRNKNNPYEIINLVVIISGIELGKYLFNVFSGWKIPKHKIILIVFNFAFACIIYWEKIEQITIKNMYTEFWIIINIFDVISDIFYFIVGIGHQSYVKKIKTDLEYGFIILELCLLSSLFVEYIN